MNRKQLAALWIGVLGFVLSGLYPPWTQEVKGITFGHAWSWLWDPPERVGYQYNIKPSVLGIEWAIIAVVIAAALLTLRTRGKSN